MNYIDYNYYLNEFRGIVVPYEELCPLMRRACMAVDILTRNVIPFSGGFDAFLSRIDSEMRSFFEQTVKKAAACQAEYLYLCKETVTAQSTVSSADIEELEKTTVSGTVETTDFSQNKKDTVLKEEKTLRFKNTKESYPVNGNICPDTYMLLAQAGLLYNGVSV